MPLNEYFAVTDPPYAKHIHCNCINSKCLMKYLLHQSSKEMCVCAGFISGLGMIVGVSYSDFNLACSVYFN